MNLQLKIMKAVQNHLRSLFPQYPFIYLGRRTGTLLLQALGKQKQTTVLMPGFICPHLSAMIEKAGKRVVHLDVDQSTMHIQSHLVDKYLTSHSISDCCLLIDHSFGYVNPDIDQIKQNYPDLLIIEDCARTLGGIWRTQPAGSSGDWVILSMYKTVRGNEHGGVLLSQTPLPCKKNGPPARTSPREYLAKIGILRKIYDKIKSIRAPLGSESAIREHIHFTEESGLPSSLITYRFLKELKSLPKDTNLHSMAWHHLYQALSQNKKLQFIKIQAQTEPSYQFLSFVIPDIKDLHSFLQQLNRAGYFLFNAWPDTPNYFRCFQNTFPYGHEGTLFLAKNIIHIPIADFLSEKKRNIFFKYFEKLL